MNALALMDDSQPPAKRGRGRPPIPYDPEIAEEICERIASSDKGLLEVISLIDGCPSYSVISKWLSNNADFEKAYALARQFQAEYMSEQILEIADETEGDAILKYDRDGNPYAAFDGRNVQRAKLMCDQRRWLMGKLNPRRYGDKLDVTSGGEPLPAPNSVTIDARVQSLMLTAQARRLMAEG